MARLNGKMLAQFLGMQQLYDKAVKNEQQGEELKEQYRRDFGNRYRRMINR